MKTVRFDIQSHQLFVCDLNPFWILILIQLTFNAQTRFRGCGTNQIDDHFVTYQRPSSPILTYERKQAMFYFVPLARARW